MYAVKNIKKTQFIDRNILSLQAIKKITTMKKVVILFSLVVIFTVSCEKSELETQQVPNVSSTPCKQGILKGSGLADKVDVEFTNKGVQITHYNFEVPCDFTIVNVTYTFVNGVLNITQQGYPNQANCVCYSDVSYTIDGISQNEVNVIFINGEQVYCHNEYNEFCLYANVEDFYKTSPLINKHLSSLPENWNDEQKLQSLTDWLNLQPCVINAKLEGVWTDRDCAIMCQPGRYANIAILLDDSGMTRELTLNIFGEYSKPLRATDYSYIKPKEVRVSFKSDITTIRDVFDFINLFDRKVLNIYRAGAGRGYLSTMPASSLDDILEILNAKPYFNRVHGYFYEYITVDVTMSNMENRDYQADWLKFMNDYHFFEGQTNWAWFMIDFEVPDGKEGEWIEKFNTYESVIGATFNYGYQSMLIQ